MEVERIREGLVDPEALRRKRELERPLCEHIRAYFEKFKTTPRSEGSLRVKRHGLRKLFMHAKRLVEREPKLADLKSDLIRRAMKREHDSGLSAVPATESARRLLRSGTGSHRRAVWTWQASASACRSSTRRLTAGGSGECSPRRNSGACSRSLPRTDALSGKRWPTTQA